MFKNGFLDYFALWFFFVLTLDCFQGYWNLKRVGIIRNLKCPKDFQCYKGKNAELCKAKFVNDLKVYDWCEKVKLSDVATVDHFYPKSKYKELKKNEKNFIISCYKCNNKKRDKLWEIEKIKFPLNNSKVEELKTII